MTKTNHERLISQKEHKSYLIKGVIWPSAFRNGGVILNFGDASTWRPAVCIDFYLAVLAAS